MKNNFSKLLVAVILTIILSGCVNSNHSRYSHDDYNDNKSIASENHYSTKYWNGIPPKSVEVEKFNGHRGILGANIDKDTETILHIQITANRGKGKLVLVRPNSDVEVLAEAISDENKTFEGDVHIKCTTGSNRIKIVGENYGGNFEINQPSEVIFKSIDKQKKYKDKNYNDTNDMFRENFPFETNTH